MMSTGAECYIQEVKPGQWHYAIQLWPYGQSQDFDKYGPFPTEQAATNHLRDNHANPGGWHSSSYEQRAE